MLMVRTLEQFNAEIREPVILREHGMSVLEYFIRGFLESVP